ncbi:MAG: aspartate aminotransferase family protein, partial [Flavobacteriaceae bacterium]
FWEKAQGLSNLVKTHLDQTTSANNERVIHYNEPDRELEFWQRFLKEGKNDHFFSEIIQHTNHTHHPRYMGHQVGAPAPLTVLTGLIGSLLNNGMAVYEMGMAPTAMERIVTDHLCHTIGWDATAGGFLTSGGTLANLTALLAARKAAVSHDIWNKGYNEPLGILVSEAAHYCVERAAKIMGLGERGIIKVPVNATHAMDVSLVEEYHTKAQAAGITIFAVVGSAPSTATGSHDALEVLGDFARTHQLWFHVDGAHGGAAILSKKYKSLLQGIHKADSVVIDGHKMMLMPTITTALLFRDVRTSHTTFSQTADYLLTEEQDWYNGGKRTFECTKTMMSLHWYALLKWYGDTLFETFLDRQYDLARTFAQHIQEHPHFELAVPPESNIVCFRHVPKGMGTAELNAHNLAVRQAILEQGTFYIVQTKLNGKWYLRTTLMNPFTEVAHVQELLGHIGTLAQTISR